MINIIEKITIVDFVESNFFDEGRDHCHLTGEYRSSAHNNCTKNITWKQSNFLPFVFHNFVNYDCNLVFKEIFDKKNDKVKFDKIPETNEGYKSVTNQCVRFSDCYRILSSSLNSLVKTLFDNILATLESLKKENFGDDKILKTVNEIEALSSEDRFIDDIKQKLPDENEKKTKLQIVIYMKMILKA